MKSHKKIWLLVIIAFIAAGCGSYYGWHATHFAKKTVVQGVAVGGLSYKAADKAIQNKLTDPTYTLEDPQTKQKLFNGKINISANHAYRQELKDLLHQRKFHPFSNKGESTKSSLYDKSAAQKALASQTAVIGRAISTANQKRTKPQNAQVTVNNGQAKLKPAVAGNMIDQKVTLAKLTKQIDPNKHPRQKVSVVFASPSWDGKDAYKKINDLLQQNFKYTAMGKTETTPVKNVLTNGTVTDKGTDIDLNPSYKYIYDINQKYALAGSQTATFTTVQDQKVSFDNTKGTLGWQLQEYNEGRYLQQQLLAGKLNIQAQNINNGNQKFDKTNLDTIKNSDHIEVDLTKEQLYLVKGNKIAQKMPVNTGTPKVNIATPTGYYYIKWRKAPMTMKGTEKDGTKYSSYVPQAMDLTDDGIFIHSAPWVAKDTFGNPAVRYERGSNGCINVAPDAMKKLFADTHQGDLVVVYGDGNAS